MRQFAKMAEGVEGLELTLALIHGGTQEAEAHGIKVLGWNGAWELDKNQ